MKLFLVILFAGVMAWFIWTVDVRGGQVLLPAGFGDR